MCDQHDMEGPAMKKLIVLTMLTLLVMPVATGHAFIDYLFGGSHSRNAVDNSAVGDLRAWWSGNPVYQFNPYYSGGTNPVQQGGPAAPPGQGQSMGMQQQGMGTPMGMQQGSYQPQPQANPTYLPQQGQQYGYGAPQAPQTYGGQPVYGSAGASLPLRGPAQTYQQQYQPMPQQYQQPVPQYQQPGQAYQQAPGQYQYPAGGYQR